MESFRQIRTSGRNYRHLRRDTGDQPGAELTRIFFQDIRVQGNTMGSREDFARLLKFVEHADLHPVIDSAYAIDDAHLAFSKIVNGDVFGKIVLHI